MCTSISCICAYLENDYRKRSGRVFLELILDEGGEGGENVQPLRHPLFHCVARLDKESTMSQVLLSVLFCVLCSVFYLNKESAMSQVL